MVRLRTVSILPVFLIALLVQIFAPVGSSLAMARASSDPFFAAVLCARAGEDGATHAPGLPLSHDDRCQLCQFVHSGAAPLAPQVADVAPRIAPTTRITWLFAAARPRGGLWRSRPRARAPPFAA